VRPRTPDRLSVYALLSQDMVEEINTSASRALKSAQKAADSLGGLIEKIEPVMMHLAKANKKIKWV
jgi:hypothetical protein